MIEQFPSPCGDKLQSTIKGDREELVGFPSPCGDKLQSTIKGDREELVGFPSPCGDKLQFIRYVVNQYKHTVFPSPCGV